jgi:tungstate transport system permease protein
MVDGVPISPNELIEITLRTLFVSGTATLLGSLIGIPLGSLLALTRFKGRRLAKTVLYTFYGFPPVVAGLVIFYLLSGHGPLGGLDLLFSVWAMIMAELILVIPLVAGITLSSVTDVDRSVLDTARALGASTRQLRATALREARSGVMTGIMVAFGGAISEVGAAMLVGGNIQYQTRVLTTAIVVETRMGNFEYAGALGAILLLISFGIYYLLGYFQERGPK